jgi:hypothetical protein
MPTNRNIVEMVQAIRSKSGGNAASGGVDGIYIAKVESVEPLTIKMHDNLITKNLFINPALMLEASDSGSKMQGVFQKSSEIPREYGFIKEFHEKYVLKKGDNVVVCMTGSSFYIAGKAVRV